MALPNITGGRQTPGKSGVKIAISGKGGVGKTTLAALLCHLYAGESKKVLAVDADPDANLGMALGVAKVFAVANKVRPGQEESIKEALHFVPLLGMLPYDPEAVNADLTGRTLFEVNPSMVEGVREIKANLERYLGQE